MDRGHVARSDCERVRPGFVAQPANAVSSLVYCAVGAWIWRRNRERSGPARRWRGVAVASVVAGLGSFAYHGPGGATSRALHDGSNVTLGVATVTATLDAGEVTDPNRLAAAAACAAAGLAVHHQSRTGRRLCRPDTLLQGHAVWHLLGAAAVGLTAAAHRHRP